MCDGKCDCNGNCGDQCKCKCDHKLFIEGRCVNCGVSYHEAQK